MSKIKMGPQTMLYPTPSTLVGAMVDGKPNFLAIAWCGVAGSVPPMISISVQHHRYSYKGIQEFKEFSVNIPSVEQVKETDYCGIYSGRNVDKVDACKFDVFYGSLKNAPLIKQCPVNLECSVSHSLNLGSHELILGKIEEAHISEECMTDGKPDVTKIRPFIFTPNTREYFAYGEMIGQAFSIGREL